MTEDPVWYHSLGKYSVIFWTEDPAWYWHKTNIHSMVGNWFIMFVGIIQEYSIISFFNKSKDNMILQPHDIVEQELFLSSVYKCQNYGSDWLNWVLGHCERSAGLEVVTLDFEAWFKLCANPLTLVVSSLLKWGWYIIFPPALKDSCEPYWATFCEATPTS